MSLSPARTARICRLAIAAAVVGVLGNWRHAPPVSLNGLEGPHDGWLVVLFAVIALAGVGSLSRGGRLGSVLVLGCSAAMLYLAVRNLVDDGEVLGGSAGWGIWLTIAAAVVSAGIALAALFRPS